MDISFVTGNEQKLNEVRGIMGYEIPQWDVDLPEIQGINQRLVIQAKLEEAVKLTDDPFFVEDTGIFITAWNGLPGVLTKWFLKAVGNYGIYRMAEPFGDTNAYVQTTIGYTAKDVPPVYFQGKVSGNIVPPRGSGFGFDPLFVPIGYDKTFGEMGTVQKNKISMRKIALEKMMEYLRW